MKILQTKKTRIIVYAAICLALCMVLPFLTGQIPKIGKALSPIHIPAFLCGFVCGPIWGGIVGLVAPLLRHVTLGSPPLANAIPMTFELAVYGLSTGILYKLFPKKLPYIYVNLVLSMIAGRLAKLIFAILSANSFIFAEFITSSVTSTLPGIIVQIILIPLIVISLKKGKLFPEDI